MYKVVLYSLILFALISCNDKGPGLSSEKGEMGGPGSGEKEITMLKEITAKDPGNADAWIRLGDTAMDYGDFRDAVGAYENALRLRPGSVDVRVDMGTCFRGLKDYNRAVEEYRKALKIDPNHLYAHKNLGIVLGFDLHKKGDAIREFEAFLKMAPNNPDSPQVANFIKELKSN